MPPKPLRSAQNRFTYWFQSLFSTLKATTDAADLIVKHGQGDWPDASYLFGLPRGTVEWPWRRPTVDGIVTLTVDPDALQRVVDALRMAESEDSDEDEIE